MIGCAGGRADVIFPVEQRPRLAEAEAVGCLFLVESEEEKVKARGR